MSRFESLYRLTKDACNDQGFVGKMECVGNTESIVHAFTLTIAIRPRTMDDYSVTVMYEPVPSILLPSTSVVQILIPINGKIGFGFLGRAR